MPFYIQAHCATRNRTYENSLGVSDQIQHPLINPFGGSFFPSSTDLWNALPDRIRNEPIQHHFIKETVKHMWNKNGHRCQKLRIPLGLNPHARPPNQETESHCLPQAQKNLKNEAILLREAAANNHQPLVIASQRYKGR